MKLSKEIECTVDLTITDAVESHVRDLIHSAAAEHQVDVKYLPINNYRITVNFGDDLDGAQALVSRADRLADDDSD
ncbi:hypothetical protein QF035_005101 [Streptomyces umbrinus]|uniref:Uncharacterized protein n=1 Tax=Streptomyces umbrinus TaxID=67370 RepID=A0ABU0SYE0_9ACTN|nr:hypothetical protein [Streptomyces umbrinus]MDQ1027519.1 hypothetical protein [Streptomyces umbrinus]